MSTELALLIGVGLLLANAFFVGAEFALVSARRTQIEPKAQQGSAVARSTLRAMERVSVEKQVRAAEFRGHPDSETAADMAARILNRRRVRRVGLEFWTAGMSHGLARSLQAQVEADWRDVGRLIDDLRLSNDIRNWPGGDMKNWPTFSSIRFRFRAPQRASAEARCGAFRGGGSCRLGW